MALKPVLLALFVNLLAVSTGLATPRDDAATGTREVLVESDGQSLREVLEQVLEGTGVSIEWRSRAAAEAPIRARAAGLPEDVASRLLRGANIVEFYADGHDGLRLRRIVVIGLRGQPKAYDPTQAKQRLRVTRSPGTRLDRDIARMHLRRDRLRQFAGHGQAMVPQRSFPGGSPKPPPAGPSGSPSKIASVPPSDTLAITRQLWPPVTGTRPPPAR